jgi:hypothetical protein
MVEVKRRFYQYVLRDLIIDLAVLLACFKISKVFFSADFKAYKNTSLVLKIYIIYSDFQGFSYFATGAYSFLFFSQRGLFAFIIS